MKRVEIHNEFMLCKTNSPDSKQGIPLGGKLKKVIGKLRKGLLDVQEGKTERVDNVESFLKKL